MALPVSVGAGAVQTENESDLLAFLEVARVIEEVGAPRFHLDDISFTINRRKPERFIVIGASTSEGYDASAYSKAYISIIQSNFTQAVCNDSSSYNMTGNAVSLLPEILVQHPGTAILMIGGNDLLFGVPERPGRRASADRGRGHHVVQTAIPNVVHVP